MDGRVRANVREGHLHDATDAVPVNVKHAKGADALLPQDALLKSIDITQANVHQLADIQAVLGSQPAKVVFVLVLGYAGQKGDRHAVDVAAVAGFGRVDIGVGVDPDDGNLATKTLAGSLGGAAHGAYGDAVVATEGQRQAALARMLVHLVGDAARDIRHGAWILHATVVRVRLGHEVRVEVDLVIAVQLVAKLVTQLSQETRLDEG